MNALGAVINRYMAIEGFSRPNPFARLELKGARGGRYDREPLTPAQLDQIALGVHQHLKDPWLTAVFWMCRCSTLGPSEAVGLAKEDIILDGDVPHVIIRPNAFRPIKTASRECVFPLVGEAFWEAKHLAISQPLNRTALSAKAERGAEEDDFKDDAETRDVFDPS